MSRIVNVRQAPYIACENWDFIWDMGDVLDVMAMWQSGKPIWEMAEYLGRKDHEVAVLVMDLVLQGRIEERRGGVYGNRRRDWAWT
jgi:hypothetical protein